MRPKKTTLAIITIIMMGFMIIGCQTTDNPISTYDITAPTAGAHSGTVTPPAPP
jgi:uncharacterized lipoprotein YajG